MFLIYFDTEKLTSYMYYTSLDRYRVLGEKNNFGEVLTGLYIYDFKIDKIIGFYDSCVFVWGLQFR